MRKTNFETTEIQWITKFLKPTKYYYTLNCNSVGGHTDSPYIAISGTSLNGQSATGTFFEFEEAGDGKYYIKTVATGEYLNPDVDQNTVSLGTQKGTSWSIVGNGETKSVFLRAGGAENKNLNNNSTSSNKLRLTDAQGACSQWTLTENVFPALAPSQTKGYKLRMQGTNLYVKFQTSGYAETNAVNATYLSTEGTIFKMEESGTGFSFKWQNQYLTTRGVTYSWNSGHSTETQYSTWRVEPAEAGKDVYYLINTQPVDPGYIFFGNDEVTPAANQYLYTNQLNTKRNIKWVLEEVDLYPETSTSASPKYYIIQNTRSFKYAKFEGDNQMMSLIEDRLESTSNVFWLETADVNGLEEGVMAVKIHNVASGKCVAAPNSFTNDGIIWYIKAGVYGGSASVAINSHASNWDDNSYGWNNYQ